MRISKREIAEIARDAGVLGIRGRRLDVSKTIEDLRGKLRLDIESHMQPYMVLLSEAVQSLIRLERYLFSRAIDKDSSPFALQVSRIRSDAIALKEVVALGQLAAAGVVGRSLIEAIDVAMAICIDEDFSHQFLNDEDQDVFWKDYIGYGKIYKKVLAFLVASGDSPEEVTTYIDRNKYIKSWLSGNVHSASPHAFQSAAVPLLSDPGFFSVGQLGAISIHSPLVCLVIARSISLFTRKCVMLTITEPLVPLESDKLTISFNAFLISVHILQSLLMKYGQELENRYLKLIECADLKNADLDPS